MALTGPETARWQKLKAEILKRPILGFKVNLTAAEAEDLLVNGLPARERLNEIDEGLRAVRQQNIKRLRPVLMSAVGRRGSAQFADKSWR